MHYFDNSADLLPDHPSRHDRLLLDGADTDGPHSKRGAPGPAAPDGQRAHSGLLEGLTLAAGPAPGPRRRGGSEARDGSHASLGALAPWHVPAARPSRDGAFAGARDGWPEPDSRPFRRVADGLAITPRVSVIVPVMNEAANLSAVFATIPAWVEEVVLVDGRSTDNTIEVARRLRPDVKVVLQGGAGKGDALVAGFTAATGDIIVAIDGDGSTDGAEIVRFVSVLIAGADFAKGSRFSSAGASDDITAIRKLGNKVLNITVNRLFGTSFSDLCYGYNAFWARHLRRLDLDSPGFEVETLMSIRAAQSGLRIYEVPSHERLRRHGTSNLSAVRDGWRILRLIVREKRAAMRRAAAGRRAGRRRKASKPKPFMAPAYLAHDGARPQPGADGYLADGCLADGYLADGYLADGYRAHGNGARRPAAPEAPLRQAAVLVPRDIGASAAAEVVAVDGLKGVTAPGNGQVKK